MCNHDLGHDSNVRDSLQEMFNRQLEVLERLQALNSELNKKYNSVDISHKWIENKFLEISKSPSERRKSLTAMRAEREALKLANSEVEATLQQLRQELLSVWQV